MLLFSHTHDPAVVLVRLSDLMAEMSSKALTPGIILCLSDDKCLLKDSTSHFEVQAEHSSWW